MFDKLFKIGLLIIAVLFLYVFHGFSQKDRYHVITQYEGSIGIFDTQQGVAYMLDIESDQWTLVKPFTPSRAI